MQIHEGSLRLRGEPNGLEIQLEWSVDALPKTLLFDLDGTLLPIDTEWFMRHYLKALEAYVNERMPIPDVPRHVLVGAYQMVKDTDPARTNEEVFASYFYAAVGVPEAELSPILRQFYLERFPQLKEAVPGLPGLARRVVEAAVSAGYEVVLATNPLFPRVAIEERLRWADVLDMPWRLITCYEEMHACKPQPEFYQEVLERIGRKPEECLMIGNDVVEDGAAAALGIDVFFVTDFLINPEGVLLPPQRSGSLASLRQRLVEGSLAHRSHQR